ncbi:MAG: cupin domain-containing protein [Cyclobacteriaceae bacterium]|jgi:quercetin dioxygenase-like cupin family protein
MKTKVDHKSQKWISGKVKGFSGKELLDLENGAVKLVGVDAQSSYPMHRHSDKTEFAYVVDGNFEFVIGDQTYNGEVGDFFIFPVMIMHAIHNRTSEGGTLLIGAIKNK